MQHTRTFWLSVLALLLALAPALRAADAPPFEIKDGDRIAYIGGTFVERDQDYSYLETLLTSRYPDRNFTFRNLGWAGDTVTGEARALFGKAPDGFERLRALVEQFKPTVLLVSYGMSESFGGESKLPEFEKNLNAMLDMLAAAAALGARFVLISPIYHEDLGRPLPDPAGHNKDLARYSAMIEKTASRRGLYFVNIQFAHAGKPLTYDGIQLNQCGYWITSVEIALQLHCRPGSWSVRLGADGSVIDAGEGNLQDVKVTSTSVSFIEEARSLPIPPPPENGSWQALHPLQLRTLRVAGLASGRWILKAGTEKLASGTAKEWGDGIPFPGGPEEAQAESLRKVIVAKNTLWFNRWRPANDTYLFGFRKHEQGRNAVEIPQFDPLIAQKEAEIAKLKVPQPVTYTLERQ